MFNFEKKKIIYEVENFKKSWDQKCSQLSCHINRYDKEENILLHFSSLSYRKT